MRRGDIGGVGGRGKGITGRQRPCTRWVARGRRDERTVTGRRQGGDVVAVVVVVVVGSGGTLQWGHRGTLGTE